MARDKTPEELTAEDAQRAAGEEGLASARALHGAGIPSTYTVQPGDTYESIAEAVYDDAELASSIHEANQGGATSTDPGILDPGTVIVLPQPAPGAATSADGAGPRRDAAPVDPAPASADVPVTGRDDELARLREENERLRGELTRGPATPPAAAATTPPDQPPA